MNESQNNLPTLSHPQRCCVCLKTFSDFTMIYYPSSDLEKAMGECCVEAYHEKRFFAEELYRCPPLKYDDPAPWEFADHAWFLLNPDRVHLLRTACALEYPELAIGKPDKVIVRRLGEEKCLKVLLNNTFSQNICDNEDFLFVVTEAALALISRDDEIICRDIRDYVITV